MAETKEGNEKEVERRRSRDSIVAIPRFFSSGFLYSLCLCICIHNIISHNEIDSCKTSNYFSQFICANKQAIEMRPREMKYEHVLGKPRNVHRICGKLIIEVEGRLKFSQCSFWIGFYCMRANLACFFYHSENLLLSFGFRWFWRWLRRTSTSAHQNNWG